MPIKKPCPRCRRIIDARQKHCAECEGFYKSRQKDYDNETRNKKHDTFYKSKEWVLIRENVLSQYDYLDVYELIVNGKIVGANTVHHIIELNEDFGRRLDLDNLIPISQATHMMVHSMYRSDRRAMQDVLRWCMSEYNKKYKT